MTDLTEAPAPRRIRFDPTRPRGGDDYGRAHRHSRRVQWLKFALPAVAAVAIVGFFLAMRFESGGDAVSLAGINIADKSLVMNAPHISGFEGTRRAYEVKAARATQDLKNPKIVTLDDIDARFGLDGTSTATLNAKQGVFNADTNLLVLQNGITISTSDGYSGTLRDAHVDIGKGTLSSANPIEIR